MSKIAVRRKAMLPPDGQFSPLLRHAPIANYLPRLTRSFHISPDVRIKMRLRSAFPDRFRCESVALSYRGPVVYHNSPQEYHGFGVRDRS